MYTTYQALPGCLRHAIIDPVHLQVSRLCATGKDEVCIANGPFLYRVKVAERIQAAMTLKGDQVEKKVVQADDFISFYSRECLDTGALSPLQSVVAGPTQDSVYSVDGGGAVRIHSVSNSSSSSGSSNSSSSSSSNDDDDDDDGGGGGAEWSSRDISEETRIMSTEGGTDTRSCGWAGLTVDKGEICSVHSMSHGIHFYDTEKEKAKRSLICAASPTAICANAMAQTNMPIHIVGEGGFLSIWDSRTSAGCSGRYALDAHDVIWSCTMKNNTEVLAAGSEKQVYVFDMRKARPVAKWNTPSKFPIISLLPSTSAGEKMYLAGHDNELMCMDPSQMAQFQSDAKKRDLHEMHDAGKLHLSYNRGIRSKAHWMGLDIVCNADNEDRILGVCASGNLYAIDYANRMELAQFV